jgi:hypothetical protein
LRGAAHQRSGFRFFSRHAPASPWNAMDDTRG